jgi:hypothetical protein
MRVGLRDNPAGQFDRAGVPEWLLACGPARVVVLAQRRLGGGPARIRPARPARVIGVQGPRTRPTGPARIVLGVHGGTGGGLRMTGGGPWRGGHPWVAAGPAAAVGGRSGRIRGGGDPPGIRGPPGPGVRAPLLAADVAQMAVGEGQRADRDDDQHPVHDHLVAEHSPEKPMTAHFLRLETSITGAGKAGLASRTVDLRARLRLLADLSRLSRPRSEFLRTGYHAEITARLITPSLTIKSAVSEMFITRASDTVRPVISC